MCVGQSERARPFGHEPLQPIERQVAHTIAIVVRDMEQASDGTDNMELTLKEAKDWVRRKSMAEKYGAK